MNFLNFEYVLAIQKVGTIRGAAEELFISPQALSEHLGKLERELGTPLFHRTKPLTLTDAGERFVICAETCLEAKKTLEGELSAITRQNDQRISLGVPTGMPPPLLLPFITYFRRTSPEMSGPITERPTRTGYFTELPGHIDVVFGEFQEENSRLLYTPILRSERFVVAIHRELLLSAMGEENARKIEDCVKQNIPVPLSLFRKCPFVLKRFGSVTRSNEDRLFRAAGFLPKGNMETGDMELTIRMVLLGEAAVYFPEPVARANLVLPSEFEENTTLLLCPVITEHEVWQLTAGYDRYRRIPSGVSILIEAAKNYYARVLGDAP